jgi:hypothetical protein
MTISHPPTDVSFIRRLQSLSCRRREESLRSGENSNDDLTRTAKASSGSVSRISSGWNRAEKMDARSDALFTAFPVELRVEVFLQFCGTYCPIGKSSKGPILLLQVCRAWKALVLQTPQFWTSFALDFQPLPSSPQMSEFLISALKGWIDRSRNLPISFKLRCPDLDAATCTSLIQCILPSSTRWRDVALHAPSASLLPLWEAKSNSFLSLRAFDLDTVGPAPFVLQSLGINWAQLTQLDLFLMTIPTLDECHHILKQGVNLTRCNMNAMCVYGPDPEHISLPKLEHLGLKLYKENTGGSPTGLPESRFLAFLETLSLPALESLQIHWNVNITQRPAQAYYWSDCCNRFADFLQGLGGRLRILHLVYLPFNTRQILRCLGVIPSLTHLNLSLSRGDKDHDFINDEFFGALTQHPGETGLLPDLQCIGLKCHGESFSNLFLLRFIASRWKYQQPISSYKLERFDLDSPKRISSYGRTRFKDLKEGRLDVAGRLKSEMTMIRVLESFLNRDFYETISFMNGEFPPDIRSLFKPE